MVREEREEGGGMHAEKERASIRHCCSIKYASFVGKSLLTVTEVEAFVRKRTFLPLIIMVYKSMLTAYRIGCVCV